MSLAPAEELDVVIFGGGGAGLWLLDDLVREGFRVVLLEAAELGLGQTVASQGIIHGGLKYSLAGLRSSAARTIRDMPLRWRQSLAGERPPNLTQTRLRAQSCHLWQTASLTSKLAMVGASVALRVRPVRIDRDERPPILSRCPGVVARIDEQVIEPPSFLADLAAQHGGRLWRIDAEHGLTFTLKSTGHVETVRLAGPQTLELRPRHVVLAAGAGNAELRGRVGLPAGAMQRRPLRMVMARGPLPELAGHCIDGAATRVTITTTRDSAGVPLWQVGGRIAEDGVGRTPAALVRAAKSELEAVLPGIDLRGVEWATYLIDRAEARSGGRRPDDVGILEEGNVITAWPTKLALVPRLAGLVRQRLGEPGGRGPNEPWARGAWPAPPVALPPWETEAQWFKDV